MKTRHRARGLCLASCPSRSFVFPIWTCPRCSSASRRPRPADRQRGSGIERWRASLLGAWRGTLQSTASTSTDLQRAPVTFAPAFRTSIWWRSPSCPRSITKPRAAPPSGRGAARARRRAPAVQARRLLRASRSEYMRRLGYAWSSTSTRRGVASPGPSSRLERAHDAAET